MKLFHVSNAEYLQIITDNETNSNIDFQIIDLLPKLQMFKNQESKFLCPKKRLFRDSGRIIRNWKHLESSEVQSGGVKTSDGN